MYSNYYLNFSQRGGGTCSLCGSPGTTKTTCPCNPEAKNPNPKKHPNWVNVCGDNNNVLSLEDLPLPALELMVEQGLLSFDDITRLRGVTKGFKKEIDQPGIKKLAKEKNWDKEISKISKILLIPYNQITNREERGIQ